MMKHDIHEPTPVRLTSDEAVGTFERWHDLATQRAALEAKGGDAEKKWLKTWIIGNGLYRVRSRSTSDDWYLVIVKDGMPHCHCKGFEYRGTCTHAAAVERRLVREGS